LILKLKVASSSLVARSRFAKEFLISIFRLNRKVKTVRPSVAQKFSVANVSLWN